MAYHGSCLCGGIRFKLMCDIETLIYCHCSRCRKESSSAFNSVTRIQKAAISFISGAELTKCYSEEGVHRHFCSNCGAHLFTSRDTMAEHYYLRVGLIEEPFQPIHKVHAYVGSKALWDEINDHYPQFEALPVQR